MRNWILSTESANGINNRFATKRKESQNGEKTKTRMWQIVRKKNIAILSSFIYECTYLYHYNDIKFTARCLEIHSLWSISSGIRVFCSSWEIKNKKSCSHKLYRIEHIHYCWQHKKACARQCYKKLLRGVDWMMFFKWLWSILIPLIIIIRYKNLFE